MGMKGQPNRGFEPSTAQPKERPCYPTELMRLVCFEVVPRELNVTQIHTNNCLVDMENNTAMNLSALVTQDETAV